MIPVLSIALVLSLMGCGLFYIKYSGEKEKVAAMISAHARQKQRYTEDIEIREKEIAHLKSVGMFRDDKGHWIKH